MNPLEYIVRFLRQISRKNLTIFARTPKIGETREVSTTEIREVNPVRNGASNVVKPPRLAVAETFTNQDQEISSKPIDRCPFCGGKHIIKRGRRKKKYEFAQLYYCYHCKKSFTTTKARGKSFPLRIILEGLGLYNLGYSAEESCRLLKEQFGLEVKPRTLRDWVHEYASLCRFSRLRPYALKLYSPNQIVQTVHLFHRQVYDFSVHRGKLALLLQEHKHAKFENLREFLEAIQAECPHQFFKEGERSSELKVDFDLSEVILKGKQNFATRLAGLVLQAVDDNKQRHKTLQKFMLCNDSVTVAVEIPLYMDKYDLEHLQDQLGFKIPIKLEKVLTGHIDILQIRNGSIYILDYKPQAAKGKRADAIRQLTLYALMLSRLTGLRIYDFKCGWFDEDDYFEFFPLHVVHKLRKKVEREDPSQMRFEEILKEEQKAGLQ